MSEWWTDLSQRERLLISIMGGLIAFLFLIFGIIQPVTSYRTAAGQNLSAARTTATIVDQAVASGDASGPGVAAVRSGGELRSAIAGMAAQSGVRLSNSRLGEDDQTVTVSVANLSTDALYKWLIDLQERETITVRDARISRSRSGQGIQAQITFAAGG